MTVKGWILVTLIFAVPLIITIPIVVKNILDQQRIDKTVCKCSNGKGEVAGLCSQNKNSVEFCSDCDKGYQISAWQKLSKEFRGPF